MFHFLVVEDIDGVDGFRYAVLERTIICCIVEDVSICVIVPVKKGVGEGIVIVIA